MTSPETRPVVWVIDPQCNYHPVTEATWYTCDAERGAHAMLKAAMDVLHARQAAGTTTGFRPLVVVLGDGAELGPDASALLPTLRAEGPAYEVRVTSWDEYWRDKTRRTDT